jgi:hypothetical protein
LTDFLTQAIATLAATPEQAAALIRGLSEEQLSWNPPSAQFSLRENIVHLRDIDVEGYLERVRLMLDQDHPTLPDLDGAKLARERKYNSQPVHPALEDMRAARATTFARLKACSSPVLERTAEMQGVGSVNLQRLLELWMEHDGAHLSDMAELRRSLETGSEAASVQHQAA